ncbi:MAG TPA: malate/lactate/ureidoglycolate dehydrogenase [Polyangiaceae bacterium]|nr:malate/lactate/ureidoglycolate dehydrogenase [Polyangiaceae bacterium]
MPSMGQDSREDELVTWREAPLREAVRALVERGGSSAREAELVAENLVLANATGHASHGVGMLPRYVDALLEGGLQVNRHVQVQLDSGPLLRLDGGSGYGQVIGKEAMELGSARAKEHGVCVVALAHAHHLGRIGHWAEQCLEQGLTSLHFVNVVTRPIVAPFGGLDARTGTNPVCIGIPRPGAEPIVLDFATSRVAQGKVRVAHNRGQQLPPGVLLDDRGEPSTDPKYGVGPPFGALLPFGEHKGFGLSLVAELLGGALTGGPTCREPASGKRRVLNGMFSVLLDTERLGTLPHFASEASAYIDWLRRSPVAPGEPGITLAGEPERAARRRALAEGIAIDRATWQEIRAAGEKLGLPGAELERLAKG